MRNYKKLVQEGITEILFHPRETGQPAATTHSSNIDIRINEAVVLGCRFHFHGGKLPTLLFFHSNGETVADYDGVAPSFQQAGINLFVATYRGYGWSSGTADVETMMSDCREIFRSVRKIMTDMEATGSLFVMGRSIGSAPAIEVCSVFSEDIKGLIIESGFADTLPLLQNLGYDTSLGPIEEKDGFGNREKIAEITMPTLILHGSLDSIIPVPQAERLQAFSGARTKKFFVIPGADHNSVLSRGGEHYFTTIKGFIDEITGNTSWRQRRRQFKDNG